MLLFVKIWKTKQRPVHRHTDSSNIFIFIEVDVRSKNEIKPKGQSKITVYNNFIIICGVFLDAQLQQIGSIRS